MGVAGIRPIIVRLEGEKALDALTPCRPASYKRVDVRCRLFDLSDDLISRSGWGTAPRCKLMRSRRHTLMRTWSPSTLYSR